MTDSALLMQAASWTPQQKELYTRVAALVAQRQPRGRRIVAIDGREGAGKRRFGDALRVAFARAGIDSYRASLADFQRPRAERERRGAGWQARYKDTFDTELVDRVLLQPFRMGGSTGFVTRAFDAQTDRDIEMEWRTAGPDAVLLLDGLYLLRPAFAGRWHVVIRLEASDSERAARLHRAEGAHPMPEHPSNDAIRLAAEHYERIADPVRRADVIVDTTDWENPVQVFADHC